MPHMNGYEAAQAIRNSANPLGRTIPIIAMTANAFSDDVQHSLAAGMDAHVSKPIDMAGAGKKLAGCFTDKKVMLKIGGLPAAAYGNSTGQAAFA